MFRVVGQPTAKCNINEQWPIFSDNPPFVLQPFHILRLGFHPLTEEEPGHDNFVLYEKIDDEVLITIYEPHGQDRVHTRVDKLVRRFGEQIGGNVQYQHVSGTSLYYEGLQHLMSDTVGRCQIIVEFMIFNIMILRELVRDEFLGRKIIFIEQYWQTKLKTGKQLSDFITLFSNATVNISNAVTGLSSYVVDIHSMEDHLNPCYDIDELKVFQLEKENWETWKNTLSPPDTRDAPMTEAGMEDTLAKYDLKPGFEVMVSTRIKIKESRIYEDNHFVCISDGHESGQYILLLNPDLERIQHFPKKNYHTLYTLCE